MVDQRGFNAFLHGLAGTYLKPKDPKLMLNTVVTKVSYNDTGVVAHTKDGTCIRADYLINTVSVGVLQAAQAGTAPLSFDPPLPSWKRNAVASFDINSYTKIFLQFEPEQQFWPNDTQYFLYADPVQRGYYPVW